MYTFSGYLFTFVMYYSNYFMSVPSSAHPYIQDPIYQHIFEQTAQAVVLLTGSGQVVTANPAALALIGLTDQKIQQVPITNLFVLEATDIQQLLSFAQPTERHTLTTHLLQHNGGMLPVTLLAFGLPALNNSNPLIYIEINDLSKEYLLHDLLAETNEAAQVGGFSYNVVQQTLYWTNVTKQIHEVPHHWQPTLADALHFYKEGADRTFVQSMLQSVLEKKDSINFEACITTAKGQEKWIRVHASAIVINGVCQHITGAIQDITTLKQKDQQLHRQQQLHEALFFQNPDAVVAVDVKGNILESNDAFTALLQLPNQQTPIGFSIMHWVMPHNHKTVERLLHTAFEGKVSETELNFSIAHNNTIVASTTLMPVVENNTIVYTYWLIKNHTEKAKQETELVNTIALLNEASKVAKVGSYKHLLANNSTEWSNMASEILFAPPHSPVNNCMLLHTRVSDTTYAQKLHRCFQNLLQSTVPFDEVMPIETNGAPATWVRITGKPILENHTCVGIFGIIQDITEQKNNEAKLWQERNLLQTLVDNLPISVFAKDKEGRKILTNPQDLLYMRATNKAEVLGKKDSDIFTWSSNHIGHLQDKRVLENGEQIHEEDEAIPKADGSYLHIKTNKIALRDANNNITGLVGFSRNVTETKQQEEQLKLVNFAFHNASVGIFLINADGSFFDLNQKAHEIFGYSKQEMLQLKVSDLNEQLNGSNWQAHWEELQQKQSFSFITRERKKDGSLIDVEIQANLIRFGDKELNCAFLTDVTLRNQMTEQLKLVDYCFRKGGVSIFFVKEDGSFLDMNEHAHNALGYTKDELMQCNIADINPAMDSIHWKAEWQKLEQDSKRSLISRHRKKNGQLIDVEIQKSLLQYGGISLNCAYVTDITERNNLLNQIRLFEHIFRKSNLSIFLLNEDGSIFDVNDTAFLWLGYSYNEMKQMSFAKIAPELVHNQRTNLDTLLRSNSSNVFITHLQSNNGLLKPVEIISTTINYGSTKMYCFFASDITERLHTQHALQKSNERYRFAMKATSNAIWEVDFEEEVMYLNESFELLFGHKLPSYAVPLSNNIWDTHVHPDDLSLVLSATSKALLTNQTTHQYDYRFYKADGSLVLVRDKLFIVRNLYGKAVRVIGAMTDITVEAQLKTTLEHTLYELGLQKFALDQHCIVAITNLEGEIEYVNDKFCEQSGYSRETLIGNQHRLLKSHEHDTAFWQQFYATITKGQVWHGEICNQSQSGKLFWQFTSVIPFIDKTTNQPSKYIAISNDITKRKEAEAEKELLVKELSNSNAELKQFGYITTHNLRSPLTNLLAICDMLEMDDLNTDTNRMLIEGFKSSTNNLKQTLDDLLEILIIKQTTHPDTSQMRFEQTFHKVMESVGNDIALSGAHIETNFSKAPVVTFNPVYLESILLNLLTNSLKYARPQVAPHITVSTHPLPQGGVQLRFSDNGLGMDMNKIAGKIFGLYKRFHNNANSKGIGLFLIQAQLHSLGGSISVHSKVNEGTTFTLNFA